MAIGPEPLAGAPGFDLWHALDSRWGDIVAKGDTLRIVQRRFGLPTDVLGLDRAARDRLGPGTAAAGLTAGHRRR